MPLIPIYDNVTYGDTTGRLADHAVAGDQQFVLLEPSTSPLTLVGDANALAQFASGGNDELVRVDGPTSAFGDALSLTGHSQGGADSIVLFGNSGSITAAGDASTMTNHAQGGNDVIQLYNANYGVSVVGVGDGETMSGHARGGDDNLITLDRTAEVYGDARLLTDHAQGGSDTVTGSGFVTPGIAAGDAETMSGHAVGGDDLVMPKFLDGGDYGYPTNLYGDAVVLTDRSQGGNDRIVGDPSWSSTMYGDGRDLLGHASGGDDTLVSSSADETMWGDAANLAPGAATGSDLFVFRPPSGHDQIMDFQPGKDHIELDGFGFTGFEDLASHFQATANGVLISFDPNDDILVRGVSAAQLASSDFVFT